MRINTTCTDQVFADSAGSVCPRRCDRSSPRDTVDRRTAAPVGGPRRLRERGKSPLQLARAVLLAIAVAPVVVSVGIPRELAGRSRPGVITVGPPGPGESASQTPT